MNLLQHYPTTPATEKYLDHPSHAKIGIHPFPARLHVVTMMSNPLRWRSRYANYWAFEKRVRDSGAFLYTAEIAYGGRAFEITEPGNPNHLQLRSTEELWHKENALNLMMHRLPTNAEYVAWIDADITFQRPDWAQETLHLLQHYDVIQMFSTAHDLNVQDEITNTYTGFMYQYAQTDVADTIRDGLAKKDAKPGAYPYMGCDGGGDRQIGGSYGYRHPGFAWAAKKSALSSVGMLIDFDILGSADWHMAWGLIGQVNRAINSNLSETYKNMVREWGAQAEKNIRRNVSYMPGSILHSFHGRKGNRNYENRWKFLVDTQFDPQTDIKRDYQGLWQLTGNKLTLRDGIREYNRLRHEDSE